MAADKASGHLAPILLTPALLLAWRRSDKSIAPSH